MTTLPARTVAALTAGALATLAIAVPALAARQNGITPLVPASGSQVAQGKAPTFKMKVRGVGTVWVYVCKSRKRDRDGLICSSEMIEKARKTAPGRFEVKTKFYDYPEFWLNNPGTYYWQAHRVHCDHGTADCSQEGPIVKFKVV